MKLNLAESIREVLYDRNPVSIYGLGTLCLKQIPASYGENRKSLLPPKMELILQDSSSTNTHLFEWLTIKYDITPEQADKAFRKFSEKVLNTLLNYGSVYIDKVALLERDGDNDIICQADDSMLSGFYEGFPEVILDVPGIDKKQAEAAVSQKDETDGDSDKVKLDEKPFDSTIETGNDTKESDAPLSVDVPTESDSDLTAEDMIVFDLESELKKLEENSYTSTVIEEASEGKSNRRMWAYILLFVALLAACFLIYDACSTYNYNRNLQTNVAVVNTIDLANAEASDSLSAAMLGGSELAAATSPDSCIIVTGVFASLSNVEAMKTKVSAFGYQTYAETNGAYTRVGLIFNCDEVELENFIQQIRREISPRAWYLQPELYVEYGTD